MASHSGNRIRWNGGREFARTVLIQSPEGMVFTRTPAHRASLLCKAGAAEIIPTKGPRIFIIRMRNATGRPAKPPTVLTPNSFSTRYTYLQLLGYSDKRLSTYTFRALDKRDRSLFHAVQDSCLV